jgi:TM2 domain-containing membrane protein YozV
MRAVDSTTDATIDDVTVPKNPGVAAVLSLAIPGVGQFYNGDFLRGLFWLIVTPGMWIGTGGLLGWVCHVIAAITAYRRAERKNLQGV